MPSAKKQKLEYQESSSVILSCSNDNFGDASLRDSFSVDVTLLSASESDSDSPVQSQHLKQDIHTDNRSASDNKMKRKQLEDDTTNVS